MFRDITRPRPSHRLVRVGRMRALGFLTLTTLLRSVGFTRTRSRCRLSYLRRNPRGELNRMRIKPTPDTPPFPIAAFRGEPGTRRRAYSFPDDDTGRSGQSLVSWSALAQTAHAVVFVQTAKVCPPLPHRKQCPSRMTSA